MNRRLFMKGLALSAAAATVIVKTDPWEGRVFGLAPVKPEDSTIGFYGATPSTPLFLPNVADNDIGMYCTSDDTLKLVVGSSARLGLIA